MSLWTKAPQHEGLMAEESTSERPVAENPDPATLRPDDFSHEQSIVVKLNEGLAVFSSCSHCGPDVVMAEVHQFMPNQPIRALIGGFHLYDTPDEEVRALAGRMKNEGVETRLHGPLHWRARLQDSAGRARQRRHQGNQKRFAHRAGRIESSKHERKPRTAHVSASERFQ